MAQVSLVSVKAPPAQCTYTDSTPAASINGLIFFNQVNVCYVLLYLRLLMCCIRVYKTGLHCSLNRFFKKN